MSGRFLHVHIIVSLAVLAAFRVACAGATLGARHHCVAAASVAKILGNHPDCVELIDGPTCTESTVRDGGCTDTRVLNFTSCGAVLYSEVADPETQQGQEEQKQDQQGLHQILGESGAAVAGAGAPRGRTFSHCAYAARTAGAPCGPEPHAGSDSGSGSGSGSSTEGRSSSNNSSDSSNSSSGDNGGYAALVPAAITTTSAKAAPAAFLGVVARRPAYECGGGGLAGMCVPVGTHAAEHHQCVEFTCDRGLCGQPVPTSEGGECAPTGPAPPPPPPPCHRRVCRSGRCVVEPLPDDSPCGPVGLCSEDVCRAGACVRNSEEDGVLCGPSSACASQVCEAGECVEERHPDGRLCWHAPGECPRTCAGGKCVPCSCGSAYAFWAGRQRLPGFHWTPFPTDLSENSFGGYFNLLEEDLDIPPVQLPHKRATAHNPLSTSSYNIKPKDSDSSDSAILVCSGCRLNMRLQPGSNMVQDGALVTGSVGLATSPVRGGTYVTLDVVLTPNVTHDHLLVGWNPWAALSPPPLHSPHRWGGSSGAGIPPRHTSPTATSTTATVSGSSSPVSTAAWSEGSPTSPLGAGAAGASGGGTSAALHHGPLPRPVTQHSAWAFVRRRPVRWAFTTLEQARSLFIGLHMTVASCSRSPPLTTGSGLATSAELAAGPRPGPKASPASGSATPAAPATAPAAEAMA